MIEGVQKNLKLTDRQIRPCRGHFKPFWIILAYFSLVLRAKRRETQRLWGGNAWLRGR